MAKDKWFVGKMYLQLVSQRANASGCRKEASDCSPYQGEGASLLVTLASKEPLDESERGQWKSWLKAQQSENEDHGIWSHHLMGNRWGNSGNSGWLYFSRLQNHCRWWLQPWNLKMVTPWKKSYDQPCQHTKSRDITLPTKVRLVKAIVFPVVIYGCESWTSKKAEHWRIDAFELWCWIRLLRVPWTARVSNQSI